MCVNVPLMNDVWRKDFAVKNIKFSAILNGFNQAFLVYNTSDVIMVIGMLYDYVCHGTMSRCYVFIQTFVK